MSDKDLNINIAVNASANTKPLDDAKTQVEDLGGAHDKAGGGARKNAAEMKLAGAMAQASSGSITGMASAVRTLAGSMEGLQKALPAIGAAFAAISAWQKVAEGLLEAANAYEGTISKIKTGNLEGELGRMADAYKRVTEEINNAAQKTDDLFNAQEKLLQAEKERNLARVELEAQNKIAETSDPLERARIRAEADQRKADIEGTYAKDSGEIERGRLDAAEAKHRADIAASEQFIADASAKMAEMNKRLEYIRSTDSAGTGSYGASVLGNTVKGLWRGDFVDMISSSSYRMQKWAANNLTDEQDAIKKGQEELLGEMRKARDNKVAAERGLGITQADRAVLDVREQTRPIQQETAKTSTQTATSDAHAAIQKREDEERKKQEQHARDQADAKAKAEQIAQLAREKEELEAQLKAAQNKLDSATAKAANSRRAYEATQRGGYSKRQQEEARRRAEQDSAALEAQRDASIEQVNALKPMIDANTKFAGVVTSEYNRLTRVLERAATDMVAGR